MFKWLFGDKGKEEKLDSILSCAKFVIDNGELVHDNSSSRCIPSVIFEDNKGNRLKISWFCSTGDVDSVRMNGRNTPPGYDNKILRMAKKRIAELQKKYLEETIKSVNN